VAIIENLDGLVTTSAPNLYGGSVATTLPLYNGRRADYAAIYRTQHEVRMVVDFLARNIAQVPLHAYRMEDDGGRDRVRGTPLARTLTRPDPDSTLSAWVEALVKDLAIYDEAFRIKVAGPDGRIALVRVPVPLVEVFGNSMLAPEGYRISGNKGAIEYEVDQVIHFHGYNPLDLRRGLSPLEALRQLIAEQVAAAEHREGLWKRGARASLVIERPATSPQWSEAARERFRADWEASYTGDAASGKTAVLEEGMTAKPLETFSPRDAQYLEVSQLSREIVASTYGIPLGLLGLGQANYSSLTEQHRQLYQDSLAPWLTKIEQVLSAQMLPDFDETDENTYLEFQLADKLRGSFEEQAAVLQASVGAPYLTRNEARARLNLPSVDGADDLVVPLNVLVGGLASPQDTARPQDRPVGTASAPEPQKKQAVDPDELERYARIRNRASERINNTILAALERQGRSVRSRLGAQTKTANGAKAEVGDLFDRERFDRELAGDLRPELVRAAEDAAATVGDWDATNATEWFDAVASATAEAMNDTMSNRIGSALDEEDATGAVANIYETLRDNEAVLAGMTLAAATFNFGRAEAAQASGRRTKTWLTTSQNPRSEHASLSGVTVGIGELFPNGAKWPGDPALPLDQRANCQCIVDFNRGL